VAPEIYSGTIRLLRPQRPCSTLRPCMSWPLSPCPLELGQVRQRGRTKNLSENSLRTPFRRDGLRFRWCRPPSRTRP